jgi:hypothetical protein
MMFIPRQRWIADTDGSTTIEFVTIFLALIAVIFFVLEMTLYMFFMATLEKAAQAGVRTAVVSTPVAAGIPVRNGKVSAGIFGISCSHGSAPCVDYGTVTCTGTACASGDFDRIFDHIKSISGQVEPDNITIRYRNVGLGYAGGPVIPLVSLSISGVQYQTGIFGLLLTNAGVLDTLPSRSASMTGEDLD